MGPTKKHNQNANNIDEFMISISNKCELLIPVAKNPMKITDNDITMLTIHNYNDITKYNYNATQLKSFAKNYKLKLAGNKSQLTNRIFAFLHLSSFTIKIQKIFRGILQRKYNLLHGPAYKNRSLCTNNCDFITLEPLNEINFHQFISYKDVDNFVYGFDIGSLYNLIFKTKKEIKNPYNRSNLPDYLFKNIKTLIKLGIILKTPINLEIEDVCIFMSAEKTIEMRCLSVFQQIDSLGNYSDPQWFLSLDRNNLIKFVRELADIWNYRAQLSTEVKRKICPPNGDPFRQINFQALHTEVNLVATKKSVLEVLEKMVNTGVDSDSKSLGAYYILGALTLVNDIAAISLPWLFQSVSHF